MEIKDSIEQIAENYDGFDGGEFIDGRDFLESIEDIPGTCLEDFVDDVKTVMDEAKVQHSINFVGMIDTCDGGAVNVYFDVVWIKDGKLDNCPVCLESEY